MTINRDADGSMRIRLRLSPSLVDRLERALEAREDVPLSRYLLDTLENATTDRGSRHGHDLPTTPSSVVWSGGHPLVLDGEPGVPTPRWWVGVDDSGEARRYAPAEVDARGWNLVFDATLAVEGHLPRRWRDGATS